MTRSGVRKSQEPCAVPVSVTTGQHPDTQTHRHTDTWTHGHRQRCTCVAWSTNRDNEIAKIIINYFRRRRHTARGNVDKRDGRTFDDDCTHIGSHSGCNASSRFVYLAFTNFVRQTYFSLCVATHVQNKTMPCHIQATDTTLLFNAAFSSMKGVQFVKQLWSFQFYFHQKVALFNVHRVPYQFLATFATVQM